NNFFVNTEMLTKARMQGLSVVEVGAHHRPRAGGQSKVRMSDIPKTLASLVPFWWTRLLCPGADHVGRGTPRGSCAGLMLVLLFAGAILFPNRSYPLIKPDEARYAEISRTMLVDGDWIVPRLDGEPYFDKPPVYYWLTALSYRLFGINERAARLVPATAAFLTILLTFVFAHRAFGVRAAFLAGLVLALTTGFVQCGRFIVLDSVFTLFVAAAFFLAHEAVRGTALHRGWWSAWAVACALAILSKGPTALALLVPAVVAFCWLHRSPARPTFRHWLTYSVV